MTSSLPHLPVYLITGLLGSGKTTALKHLLAQKPPDEYWGIIINEFGEIDIDAATLSQSSANTQIRSVAGGCVCCSAQHGLKQAIDQLIKASSQTPLSRLWIEPTGLGHPANIIDTLTRYPFSTPLTLQKTVCVITPQQLTQARWNRSAVMRDLVTLADTLLLNKTDLSSKQATQNALQLLGKLYPKKSDIIQTQHSKMALHHLLKTHSSPTFKLLSSPTQLSPSQEDIAHLKSSDTRSHSVPSHISGTTLCVIQTQNATNELHSIGWVFNNQLQFNRVKLKQFFTHLTPLLVRAKGILKTGNEWQLINWSHNGNKAQLTLEDIAWRQDSRLECLFNNSNEHQTLKSITQIENQLLKCLVTKT